MNYYVGIGGIGCRTVEDFCEKSKVEKEHCFYIDTDTIKREVESENVYIVEGMEYGTSVCRNIGRSAIKKVLYSRKMDNFFDRIIADKPDVICFVVSSFGGFGGATVTEIIEYLTVNNVGDSNNNYRVIAFNENYMQKLGIPDVMMQCFESNTIELLNEYKGRFDLNLYNLNQSNLLLARYGFFLIDTSEILQEDFWEIVKLPELKLKLLDNKTLYDIKPQRKSPLIFISYSSIDQKIADMLVECLEKRGLDCWIASRNIHEGSYAKQIMQGIRGASVFIVLISKNSIASEQVKNEIDRAFNRIKEGMKIIPFILDDSELDEECEYYLCRQEMFFGKKPPVRKRIDELCQLIENIFE